MHGRVVHDAMHGRVVHDAMHGRVVRDAMHGRVVRDAMHQVLYDRNTIAVYIYRYLRICIDDMSHPCAAVATRIPSVTRQYMQQSSGRYVTQ